MRQAYRIVESLLEDLNVPKDIIYKDEVIKDGIAICPHCGEEIHEKGTRWNENEQTVHNRCGGILRDKPPSDEEIKGMRAWGMDYDRATGKFTPLSIPGGVKNDPDDQDDNFDEYA